MSVCVFCCVCVRALGLRLFGGAVGEILELLLVDLSDDGLVGGRQHRILLGEVLVEVVHVPLGLLHGHTHTHTQIGEDVRRSTAVTPCDQKRNYVFGKPHGNRLLQLNVCA